MNNCVPLPVFGNSVHISLTPSNTMLQCLSNAFTLPSNFLLFLKFKWLQSSLKIILISRLTAYLQLMRTWVLFFTLSVSTLRGPVWNSSCSLASLSSGVISFLLLIIRPFNFLIFCNSENKRLLFSYKQIHAWPGCTVVATRIAAAIYQTIRRQHRPPRNKLIR